MQLHNLPKLTRKSKRIGRGGKRGTTSGRGQKGQKSRAGHRIRPAERDLIIRIPKHRGFKNKPKSPKPLVFNLKDVSLVIKKQGVGSGAVTVDKKFLSDAGFLSGNFRRSVKMLGDGEINVPLRVVGIRVSAGAKKKIEKAGGTVQ